MSTIEIRKIGITDLDTDAIVNAANDGLGERFLCGMSLWRTCIFPLLGRC